MKNKIDEMMSSFLGDAGVVRVKFSVHVVKKITIEVGEIVGFVRCRRQLNMCCYRICRRSNYPRHAFRYPWIVSVDGALI